MDLSGHEGEIPSPTTSKFSGAYGHSLPSDSPSLHSSSDGPPLPPLSTTPTVEQQPTNYSTKRGGAVAVVRYRECLKNHAASIGGNATDGCGEFMPSGEEGTLEALMCLACSCHRNFHRKEIEGECHHHHLKETNFVGHKGVLISGAEAFGYNNPAVQCLIPSPLPHQMVMPLGALMTSESDEMEGVGGARAPPMGKKRVRTKFAPEQKEKMLRFAERIGWRLQRQEESVVEQFCQEIGVKRKVLRVWMHNNKHNLAKKELPQVE